VPDDVVLVSESGIKSVEDAVRLAACGADALLVGETLMRHEFPMEMARALRVEKEVVVE
jgi:indole-3-glycerol phosphate synthase